MARSYSQRLEQYNQFDTKKPVEKPLFSSHLSPLPIATGRGEGQSNITPKSKQIFEQMFTTGLKICGKLEITLTTEYAAPFAAATNFLHSPESAKNASASAAICATKFPPHVCDQRKSLWEGGAAVGTYYPGGIKSPYCCRCRGG